MAIASYARTPSVRSAEDGSELRYGHHVRATPDPVILAVKRGVVKTDSLARVVFRGGLVGHAPQHFAPPPGRQQRPALNGPPAAPHDVRPAVRVDEFQAGTL